MKIFKLSLLAATVLGSNFVLTAYADFPANCSSLPITIQNKSIYSLTTKSDDPGCPILQSSINPQASGQVTVSVQQRACHYTLIPQQPQSSNQLVDATPLTISIFCLPNSSGVTVEGVNFDIAVQSPISQTVVIADNDN